jgi:hypothetical protein
MDECSISHPSTSYIPLLANDMKPILLVILAGGILLYISKNNRRLQPIKHKSLEQSLSKKNYPHFLINNK